MARRLEGKPFHLLATHRQRGTRENVVAYVKSKGLSPDSPNMSVTSFGGHPKVKGNGYVPYYMVFDHHGDLVQHHMCGDYHGGDGLAMIDLVDRLLADVPAMYLGKEPFVELPRLGKQVGKLRRLPAAIADIEKQLAAAPTAAERVELERLQAAIEDYRTRMLALVERLSATAPGEVVPHLKALQKHFVGTASAPAIAEQLAELAKSKAHADAVRIDRSFRKTMARLESKEVTAKRKRSAIKKLAKLVEGHDGLPVSAKIRAAIAELER